MERPTESTSSPLKLASAGEAWNTPWMLPTLLAGLRREGLSESASQWIEALLDHARDLDHLIYVVAAQPSGTDRDAALAALERLREIARFNEQRYRRLDAEDERVTAWPNNQRTKIADPDFYFDIHEDLPYRYAHRFITRETPIGSAGSCFALRIAHQLQAWNYNYVIEEDDLPPDVPLEQLSRTAFRMAPARCGTLFNIPSMRQMVERGFGVWEPEKLLVRDGGRFLDPFRSIKANYTDEAGYLADFARHTEAIRRALLKCDVFILTLGLTEAWRFAHSGDFTSIAPHKVEPSLVRAHELTVAENVAELERLLAVYKRFKPNIKLIISVSPVPLAKTFSVRQHVVAANALSKATLRVAADEFCRAHPDEAFYFPSYEVVMYGTDEPWESDMRHVSGKAVARVMFLFRKMFLADQDSHLPLLTYDEVAEDRGPMLRAKGWAKAALRTPGLYRRK